MRGFQQDKSLPYCFEHYHSPHLSHFNFALLAKITLKHFSSVSHNSLTHSLSFPWFFSSKSLFSHHIHQQQQQYPPMSDRYRPRGPRNQQRGGYQSRSSYIPQRRDNRNRDSYIPSGPKGWQRGITIDLTMTDTNNKRIDLHHQYHRESPSSLSGERLCTTTQRAKRFLCIWNEKTIAFDQQASGKDVISI